MSSSSSQGLLQLLRREPRYRPAPPGAGQSAISCDVNFVIAAGRGPELKSLVGGFFGADFSQTSTTAKLTFCDGWVACDVRRRGILGRNVTYLMDPDGGHSLVDCGQKLYVSFDKDQLPPAQPMAMAQVLLSAEKGAAIEGRNTQVATLDVSQPRIRLRIWCVHDPALKPVSRALFTRLVGCPDRFGAAGFPVAEVLAHGTPVRVEGYSLLYGIANEPLTITAATGFHAGPAHPSVFTIPAGYIDLRNADGIKPGTSGPGVETALVSLRGFSPNQRSAQRGGGV